MREMHANRPRFEDLTETTGIPLSWEGAQMMYTRYRVAANLAGGKRLLELGCGSGQGFGLIGEAARRIVGGDLSLPLLRDGHRHYRGRFPFVQLSAEALPFCDAAFDLVLFFEASYYVPSVDRAFREIARVLAPGGTVLIVNANPERPDFIRSPHSVRYHTADQLRTLLRALGFKVSVEAAFPVRESGGQGQTITKAVAVARQALETLHLVPRTLRGRARLKRLVYGKLVVVPPELCEGFASLAVRTVVPPGPVSGFKVLYVSATKRNSMSDA